MCLNAVNRLLEDFLLGYKSIKRHSEIEEYFVPYCENPSYYWNDQTYNYLGHSLFVAMTNETCVKYYIAPQAYKVVNNNAHEIS